MVVAIILGVLFFAFVATVPVAILIVVGRNKAKREAREIIESGYFNDPAKVDRIIKTLSVARDHESAFLSQGLCELRYSEPIKKASGSDFDAATTPTGIRELIQAVVFPKRIQLINEGLDRSYSWVLCFVLFSLCGSLVAKVIAPKAGPLLLDGYFHQFHWH